MSRFIFRTVVMSLLSGFCLACADAPTVVKNSPPQPGASQAPISPPALGQSSDVAGDLRFKAPEGWVTERPSSSMRFAQYQLPRAEGEADDVPLVVYYFGQGQGGSIDANFKRWVDQMGQPLEKAQRQTLTVNGLSVTLLDVTGTYSGDMTPGSGSGAGGGKPNSRLRGAVIETPKGPYFVKLVGLEKTVSKWEKEFLSFVKSAEFK